ncbi:ATP-binding protein [Streptomyces sp. TRM66268-LWL]|uniref:ATP-binding protein n=1 Tax=Streptomyces polyasparticus TaxID=2767826 RepID=A0ABR7SSH5_9ACTN|nr:ATP-binding protein [Streptomyces polyasparticus]MBC9718441.1 ATP-binding protein [Streptomyces polyasparticus]
MNPSPGKAMMTSAVRMGGFARTKDNMPTSAADSSRPVSQVLPSPVTASVESTPQQVSALRRISGTWLRNACRMPRDRTDLALVVISEFATNAVRHSGTAELNYRGYCPRLGYVRFEIDDGTSTRVPAPQQAKPDDESGRGLFLVSALINELGGTWGFSTDGTTAWCCFPIHEGQLETRRRDS